MRIINCHLCDKEIEVNSVNKYCLDCRKERASSHQRNYQRKKATKDKAKKKAKEVYHQKFPNARYYAK